MQHKITVLIERLAKIGIKLELIGNYPWIYLRGVKGNKVKETYLSNYGFTIGFLK